MRPSSPTTLLELISAIHEVTGDDGEVVATALHMIRSGRVKLCADSGPPAGPDLVAPV